MRHRIIPVLTLLLLTAAVSASQAGDPEVRRVDEDGLGTLLAGRRGEVVLLNLWATWCEPCREEFPALVRFQKEYRDRGVAVVFVSVDDPDQAGEVVAPFLKAHGVTGPAYVKDAKKDGAFIDRLDPDWSGAIPATFVYDRSGKRVGTLVGAQTFEGLAGVVAPLIASAEAEEAPEEVADPEALFRWSAEVVPKEVPPGGRAEVRLTLGIAKGHLVYRERTSVKFGAPPGVQVGEAAFPASHQKHDPVTGEEVAAFTGEPTFTFVAPLIVAPDAKAGEVTFTAVVRYQGCSPKLCYLPTTKRIDIVFKVEGQALTPTPLPHVGEGKTSVANRGEGLQDFSQGRTGLLARGRLWALLLTFLGGMLTSLTPCVYPLIPITIGIFGARGAGSLIERLALSVAYVLGIAAMYSGLGLAAASTGAVFGQVMSNPWVIGVVAAVFAAFGASMLGAFEIQLSAGLQARLNRVGGKGYGGAFAMGLVGGIIAAPCTGPALGAVLTYVATTGDLTFGFYLLFTFAMGLGVLFIVIGTFSGAVAALPRSGGWMEGVKSVMGIVMLAAALFYLKDVVPPLKKALDRSTWAFVSAGAAILVGVAIGAVHKSFHGASPGVRLRKGLGVALCVAGVYLIAGAFTVTASVPAPDWVKDEAAGLAQAREAGKPAMIDFYADWCAACVELDQHTYSDAGVRDKLKGFMSIKMDFTEESEATRALQKKYRLVGLPTVIFFDGQGNELPEKRLTGFIPPDRFLAHVADIR